MNTLPAFLRTFEKKIKIEGWFSSNTPLLIGLSGGIDSMSLLFALKTLGYNLTAAHVNYSLRGDQSDKDEELVRRFCKKNDITLWVIKTNTKEYAVCQKLGIQEAARNIRYEFFRDLIRQYDYKYILTAHHLDDKIETLLYQLSKGTSIRGLQSIVEKQDLIIRPFLDFKKSEIVAFAIENQIPWRNDQSNASNQYARNRLRNEVIPHLLKINPGLWSSQQNNFTRFAALEQIFEDHFAKFKENFVQECDDRTFIKKESLNRLPGIEILLEEYLKPMGFTLSQVQNLLKTTHSGKAFYSHCYQIFTTNKKIEISKKEDIAKKKIEIVGEGIYEFENYIMSVKSVANINLDFQNKNIFYCSLSLFHSPIYLKYWEEGDRIQPFGMKGTSTISDYLTNIKIGGIEKKKQLVLQIGNDIAWIIGRRSSEKYRISCNEGTIFSISITKKNKIS